LLKRLFLVGVILFTFNNTVHASIEGCDRLTASTHDKNTTGEPVDYPTLRAHADDAVNACKLALDEQSENPRIQYQLGRALLAQGNDEEAAKWMRVSADASYPVAQNAYGVLLNHGRGVAIDVKRALAYIKAAAEQGNVPAMANLGALKINVATHASADKVDQEQGIKWLTKAANEDDPLALARLGWNYGMGDAGVEKNKEISYGYLDRALELDEESAHYIILEVMASGFNEWQKAQKLHKQFKDSKNRLARLYANNFSYTAKRIKEFSDIGFRFDRPDVEPLYIREFIFDQDAYHAETMDSMMDSMNSKARTAAEEFIKRVEAARQKKFPEPEIDDTKPSLTRTIDFGTKTECDDLASSPSDELSKAPAISYETLLISAEKAIEVCRGAVDKDSSNIRAHYLLGRSLIAFGRYSEASQWITQAAKAGYPSAMNVLGVLLNHGRGVKQNYDESFVWLKKAAEAGNGAAAINLATAYFMGLGVELNSSYGTAWTKVAVERKDPKGIFTLGAAYSVSPIWYRKVNVRRDDEKGAELLFEAHNLGDLDATYALYAISFEPGFGKLRKNYGLKSGEYYRKLAEKKGDRLALVWKLAKKMNSAESVISVLEQFIEIPHPVDRVEQEPIYVIDSFMDNEHVIGELLGGFTHGKPYHFGVNEEVTAVYHKLTDSKRSFERPRN